MTARPIYPVPAEGPDDPRLSDQVVDRVAHALISSGFPPFDAGPDEDRLRTALRWFAYGTGSLGLEYCPTCGERMDWIRRGLAGHLAGAPCAEPDAPDANS